LETLDFGKILQFRLQDFLKVSEQHDTGAMSDEQYALWKSKYPLYLSDRGGEKVIAKASETPAAEQQRPKKKRKRKINNGK
jgi:hypothetical protein